MNINRKIQMIFAVIIIALAISLPSMAEAAAKNSGKCGKNVTWSFDKTTGTLTISGKGDMYDYDDMNNRTAWKDKDVKKVNINEGVTKIGNYAFYGFYNLALVSIPDSMVTVGDYAFAGAAFLKSIDFPDNVTSIGEMALNETSLGKIVIGKSYTDWKLDLPSGSLPGEEHTFDFDISKDNPKYMVLNGMVMTKDGKTVVCTEQNLIDVVIPDSVKVIEEGAFASCVGLKTIVIPEGVTSIGKRAFVGDESLKNISIPNSVTYIGEDAFRYCEGLESLSIGSGLKDWNKRPEKDRFLGHPYFDECKSLKKVTISEDNKNFKIEKGLILSKNGKEVVCALKFADNYELPEGIEKVPDYFFSDIESITSIKIPDTVKSIGIEAFKRCKNLKEVILPDNLLSIGDSAFYCCENLKTITIPDQLETLGKLAFCNTNIEKVVIPSGVKEIPFAAFSGCDALSEVEIKEGTAAIRESAFHYCTAIKPMVIPASVKTLEKGFCANNTKLIFQGGISKSIGCFFKVKRYREKCSADLQWYAIDGASGYQIAYTYDKNFRKAVKIVDAKNQLTYTVKNPKKIKGYYFKVRAYQYVNGKTVFGEWSQN